MSESTPDSLGSASADLDTEISSSLIVQLSRIGLAQSSLAATIAEHPSSSGMQETKSGSPTTDTLSAIEKLPTELILHITRDLAPADCASLALTSRAMLGTLGKGVLKLKHDDRMSLLRLLEKQGYLPSHILCGSCKTFHKPIMTLLWIQTALKDPNEPPWPKCAKTGLNLPIEIPFTTIAAIARSAKHSSDLYLSRALDVHGRFGLAGIKPLIKVNMNWKVIEGHVFLRKKSCFFSLTSGVEAVRAAAELGEIVSRSYSTLVHVCGHTYWTDRYNFILPSRYKRPEYVAARHKCFWSHPLGCSKPECGTLTDVLSNHQVCRVCPTIYLTEKLDLPNPSGNSPQRAVVVTTWHDLGPGESPYDNEWLLFKGWAYRAPVGRRYDAYDAAIRALQRY